MIRNPEDRFSHITVQIMFDILKKLNVKRWQYYPPPPLAEHCGSVGRGLDWRLKGCWFVRHCRHSHCVVFLSKTLYPLLGTVSTTVKPFLSCLAKIDKTKILMTNCSKMKVKYCRMLLQYFWPALSDNRS